METRQHARPVVAVLGTRFVDFQVERDVIGDVEIRSGSGRSPTEILEVARDADVILAGAGPRFDADTIRQLDCLGLVRLGVGVDTLDLDAAQGRGMWVSYVPDYGTEAVALHAVTMALAAIRRLPLADRHIRSGSWGFSHLRPLHLPAALTVGLVGFGRIGRRVADMLAGVGFPRFLVADPQLTPATELPPATELVTFEEVLAGSDVVTLHAPSLDGRPLLGATELAMMRAGSVVINTARGALIDTPALVAALAAGRPAIAALDVFSSEPPDVSGFESISDQVILSPHMAWYTEETELELRRQGAAEARRILAGEDPLNPIVTPRITEVKSR